MPNITRKNYVSATGGALDVPSLQCMRRTLQKWKIVPLTNCKGSIGRSATYLESELSYISQFVTFKEPPGCVLEYRPSDAINEVGYSLFEIFIWRGPFNSFLKDYTECLGAVGGGEQREREKKEGMNENKVYQSFCRTL